MLGALILAKLINSVLTAFEGTLRVDSVFCWSDSQIALWWIWGVNREFKQFVQNRVVEIRGLVKTAHWDYCPAENNPADIYSRGSLASKLVANQLWWNGPEFLLKGKDAWPNLPVNPEVISTEPDTWLQLKKESSSSQKKQCNSTVLANVVADRITSERKLNLDCIIPLKVFSSLQRLIRVTAYVLRFVSNVKRKNEKKELTDEDLKQEEIERARELWIKVLFWTTRNLTRSKFRYHCTKMTKELLGVEAVSRMHQSRLKLAFLYFYQGRPTSQISSRRMLLFSAPRTYGAKFCERRRINLHVQNKSHVIGQKI